MNRYDQELVGSILSTIGTIEDAYANTPQFRLNNDQTYFHSLVGNTLQAVGSALIADNENENFSSLGNILQVIGNTAVVTGILLYRETDQLKEKELSIIGSWIQALGSFVDLIGDLYNKNSWNKAESISGSLLEGIGNSLQAIGGNQALQDNTSELVSIEMIGSWIQATGSLILLIGVMEESEIS